MQETSDACMKDALLELLRINASDRDTLLQKIAAVASKPFTGVSSSIWLCDEEKKALECRAQDSKVAVALAAYTSCDMIMNEAAPRIVPLAKNADIVSLLLTPILIANETVGVLAQASHRNAKRWEKADMDFSMSVVNVIAFHLERMNNSIIGQQLRECKKLLNNSGLAEKEQKVELLAQALEQTNQMVFITDKNGVIIYANDAVFK
jgi:PAS domain-containing protein